MSANRLELSALVVRRVVWISAAEYLRGLCWVDPQFFVARRAGR